MLGEEASSLDGADAMAWKHRIFGQERFTKVERRMLLVVEQLMATR
jgi:hypothetical protein